ncbi:MAG: cadherin-like domain-containing protein [Acidobacteria bacterium]|nr:cadherin-like domain-containing protein [Acidobacteriota bacterium]
MSGISALTVAMHGFHASQTDPDTGQRLGDSGERAACYRCHPGPETRFLRGAMGRAVAEDGTPAMHCQSCHGTLGVLAASGRRGWLEEPYCQACHTGTAMNNAGQIRFTNAFAGSSWRRFFFTDYATERDINDGSVVLYRSSRGHGGLQCAACHGATHAESPSAHDNDNLQSVDLQGFAGTLSECGVCHRDGKVYEAGGPHNMHSVGSAWVAVHDSFAERSVEPCRECHGRDLKGTLLSRALADRSIQSKLGTLQVWRGFQIGCATCHLGELDDRPNPNKPPVVSNASAAVASGQSATIALTASDADNNPLTVRIVSQPKGGTVALSRTTATYRANPDFEGADQFTYAAWDGAIDSNLGKVTVTVTAKERPVLTAQGVTNAASFEPGLAPGLLTTIFGSGMGPAVLAPGRFLSGGFMRKELASTRVLFNGVAAPLVYVSGGLLTAVAPYSLAGSTQASVVIEYAGIRSAPVTVPVAPVAPGVFTANATGKGPVLNLSSDPVTPGAAVVLYVTGEGATAPPGVDGKLAVVPLPQPMQPISVRIGGKDAQVLYSGGAPGLVAGVMQLNVVVPPDLSPGTVTLVVLSGTVESQPGVTLEVR